MMHARSHCTTSKSLFDVLFEFFLILPFIFVRLSHFLDNFSDFFLIFSPSLFYVAYVFVSGSGNRVSTFKRLFVITIATALKHYYWNGKSN